MSDNELYIGPTALEPGAPEGPGTGHRIAQLLVIPLALILVAVILIFYVFFQRGRVVGPSMLPTLRNEDMVLVSKGYDTPRRGDIIFTWVDEQGQRIEVVKRVIALPGDTIEVRNDVAYINGQAEPARGQVISPRHSDSVDKYTVPADHLYVMGDNRLESEDSRYIGPVPISGAMGRVVAIYAPFQRIRLVR
ncbi:MAG: signal peptidase I [Coriobacteriia bacterium]|nr:signal peptidase I [Coriobacteriia bacterium]